MDKIIITTNKDCKMREPKGCFCSPRYAYKICDECKKKIIFRYIYRLAKNRSNLRVAVIKM